MMTKEKILRKISGELMRSDSQKATAIATYAYGLIDELDSGEEIPDSKEKLHNLLLHGIQDWQAYSRGGYALIYEEDIEDLIGSSDNLLRKQGEYLAMAEQMIFNLLNI